MASARRGAGPPPPCRRQERGTTVASQPHITCSSASTTATPGPISEGHRSADAPVRDDAPALQPAPPHAASHWMHTFIAAAAHDLKNELAVVRGTSQLL